MSDILYVGRFAPSPTGPLHFGSVIAAAASYLDARACGGKWLVRMEDVDETRTEQGAASGILRLLDALGMEWDDEIVVQSRRKALYREALASLSPMTFECSCSRRDYSGIYPGTCRNGAKGPARAVRLKVADREIAFVDRIQGKVSQNLAREVGDYVLFRADGFFAYQLAVVVDDIDQGVNHVVRGADLLDSTPRQIYLQRLLGADSPQYAHLPVAVDQAGEKLSKQTKAQPAQAGVEVLFRALEFLGQNPPCELREADIADFWKWAISAWDIEKVPKKAKIREGK
ncbi:MAG: tRNA glutamyl-Q(34) synthetase GluQRS [Burkholderiales bacterium]|nr:tRNA glutamyl-Q(34) synthetase GluQRS [Burkholderiales bacterium]